MQSILHLVASSPRQRASAAPVATNLAEILSGCLRAADVALLLLAGAVPFLSAAPVGGDYAATLLLASLLLPFVLDKTGSYRPDALNHPGVLVRNTAFGCVMLFGGLIAAGLLTDTLGQTLRGWALFWFAASLGAMLAVRLVTALAIRRQTAAGRLRETVAIVGTPDRALTDRLAASCTVVGTFDETALAELVALGQTSRLDKVVVTLAARERLPEIVHVLKSLAVDIMLAPTGGHAAPSLRLAA